MSLIVVKCPHDVDTRYARCMRCEDPAFDAAKQPAIEPPVFLQAPPELRAQVDEALGLQMISIRFHKPTLDELKRIAAEVGMGYQPLLRAIVENWLATRHTSEPR